MLTAVVSICAPPSAIQRHQSVVMSTGMIHMRSTLVLGRIVVGVVRLWLPGNLTESKLNHGTWKCIATSMRYVVDRSNISSRSDHRKQVQGGTYGYTKAYIYLGDMNNSKQMIEFMSNMHKLTGKSLKFKKWCTEV